jgi:glycolate oxidase FAD binding subunit
VEIVGESLAIDGFGPLPVLAPATVAEAAAIVAGERAHGHAVYPVGGGTNLEYGLMPSKPGVVIRTTAWDRVLDYPHDDMTITVEAGMTLAALQAMLATKGQWLPLDAVDPERQTLGGLLATDSAGPRRFGYGTLRDFVIGIRFIDDQGREIQGGGRVVKNVAGYDLMKLHTGALGSFGVITQLTLKVRPKPERSAIVKFSVSAAKLDAALETIRVSPARPTAVNVSGLAGLLVGQVLLEEKAGTVSEHAAILMSQLAKAGIACTDSGSESDGSIAEKIQAATTGSRFVGQPFLTRIAMRPSQVPEWIAKLPEALVVHVEAFNGIAFVGHAEPWDGPSIGNRVVLRAPAAWKTPERVFGPRTPAWDLMAHIKATLDPEGVLNPGRMFASRSGS